jgi:hypothetical protein
MFPPQTGSLQECPQGSVVACGVGTHWPVLPSPPTKVSQWPLGSRTIAFRALAAGSNPASGAVRQSVFLLFLLPYDRDSCCHKVTLTLARDHLELYSISMGNPFNPKQRDREGEGE